MGGKGVEWEDMLFSTAEPRGEPNCEGKMGRRSLAGCSQERSSGLFKVGGKGGLPRKREVVERRSAGKRVLSWTLSLGRVRRGSGSRPGGAFDGGES